jgi:3-hydroxyisobutyrate dehydrogenase-like beta-hydroxyacid dehydrogenase
MTEQIGIVSPGAMGSAVGRSLVGAGQRVAVALEGRTAATRERSVGAGLEDAGSVAALAAGSDVLLSIVPPASALEVATALALAVRPGTLVVDANAISPARAREVAAVIEGSGAVYIDGGIVGGPPRPGGRTDLFLSGPGAEVLATRLAGDGLACTAISSGQTDASALKMCHAAWTKGTSALLISIRAVARREEVDDALVSLWTRSLPDVLARSEREGAVAGRAWRWVDEMAEIERTFEEAGVPGGAAEAASRLYERLASYKDATTPPDLDELVAAVLS